MIDDYSDDNSDTGPIESHEVVAERPPERDPSRGVAIEKFIAIVIVVTLLVSLIAAVPRMLI